MTLLAIYGASVHLALALWVPATLLLFAALPRRVALLSCFVLGWLFLPQAEIPVPGVLPDLDRRMLVHTSALLALLLLDPWSLLRVRPSRWDLPVLVWCACPLFSSLTNGLGLYDGVGSVMQRSLTWGIPFLLARVYLSDLRGLRSLAWALVCAAALYVPFCLYEARMSPQLHAMVYGFQQHEFLQTRRLGGWRPLVFLQHGLAVGLLMAGGALTVLQLHVTSPRNGRRRLTGLALGGLLLATLACRSLGAMLLLGVGLFGLSLCRALGRAWPLVLVSLLPVLYVSARVTGTWSGQGVVPLVAAHVSPERARSVTYRLDNEDLLVPRAKERLLFGWGGYDRAAVLDNDGRAKTVVDGAWIQALGQNGALGLTAFYLALLLPIWGLAARLPAGAWSSAAWAGATALAFVLSVYALDSLLNAMFNPFPILAAGALSGLLAQAPDTTPRVRATLRLADQ